MKKYYVYTLECVSQSKRNFGKLWFYTGQTSNMNRRWLEHCDPRTRVAWMKRNKIYPKKVVCYEIFLSRREAVHREKQIKTYSKKKKQELVDKFREIHGGYGVDYSTIRGLV